VTSTVTAAGRTAVGRVLQWAAWFAVAGPNWRRSHRHSALWLRSRRYSLLWALLRARSPGSSQPAQPHSLL